MSQSTGFEGTEKEICDRVYVFGRISPRKLQRLLIKVAKVAGEPLADAIGGDDATDLAKTDVEAAKKKVNVGGIIKALAKNLDADVVDDIMIDLFQKTAIGGFGYIHSKNIDDAFETLPEMYKAMAAAAEVYFGDFFEGGLGLVGFQSKK